MLSISIWQTTPYFPISSLPDMMYFDIQWLPKAQPGREEITARDRTVTFLDYETNYLRASLKCSMEKKKPYDNNLCHGLKLGFQPNQQSFQTVADSSSMSPRMAAVKCLVYFLSD